MRRSTSAGTNSWKITGATETWSSRAYSAWPIIRVSRQFSIVAEKALQITRPRPTRSMNARASSGSLVTRVCGTTRPTERAAGSCQVFIIEVRIARGGLTQVIGSASQKPLIAS